MPLCDGCTRTVGRAGSACPSCPIPARAGMSRAMLNALVAFGAPEAYVWAGGGLGHYPQAYVRTLRTAGLIRRRDGAAYVLTPAGVDAWRRARAAMETS